MAQINDYDSSAEPGRDIRSIVLRHNQNTATMAKLKRQMDPATYSVLEERVEDVAMLMRTDLARACSETRALESDLK